jgi:hypothetical protein
MGMNVLRWSVLIGAVGLAACGEIPQDAPKPYAGKADTQAYADDRWKGDKAKYEKALADRAKFQDDYQRSRMYEPSK